MKVKIGYEIGTGEEVSIEPSHMIVCGLTQKSGKTTTIEAFITRSKKTAVVFKTKPGEKSFDNTGHNIAPFISMKTDYEFVRALLEHSSGEKLTSEKTALIELCQGSSSLDEIKKIIDNSLVSGAKINRGVYIRLQHYLNSLISQMKKVKLSRTFSIKSGINIMDIQDFPEDIQALVIQSTLNEILKNHAGVIAILPEAWKFCPERRNTPCKIAIESFIRQGATNNNFLIMDSQDLSGTDKGPIKQVSVYFLGYQSEINEVKHTLAQIPLPSKAKPTPDQIMTLKVGQFYLATNEGVRKTYVQPTWLDDKSAKDVAMGKEVSMNVGQRGGKSKSLAERIEDENAKGNNRIIVIDDIGDEIKGIKPSEVVNPNTPPTVFSVPRTQPPLFSGSYDEKLSLLESRISSLEKGVAPVYMISPLEKIQKDFQAEAVNFVLSEVAKLDEDQKKILLFVESQKKGCSLTMIVDKCLHLSATSGGTRDKYAKKIKEMDSLQVTRKDKNSVVYPNLKDFISSYCSVHGATEQEMRQVYDHVLGGLVK